MNKELQKYIRESFPEYSKITVSEILSIKYNDADFIENISKIYGFHNIVNYFMIKEFFIIDIGEFFDRYRSQFTDVFIDVDSFQLNMVNGFYSISLHDNYQNLGLFFINNLKDNDILIKYKNETFKYNQYNLDNIMFKFVSSIQQNKTTDNTLSSFIFGYLRYNTDLANFLDITLSNNTITIATYYNLFYQNESNNPKKHNLQIQCANNYISILDYNSNILIKKEIEQINKDNFFNEIVGPLKNIIFDMDNIRKEQFQTLWKQDVYHYLSLCLFIDKQDLDVIQIKVFRPEIKSKFLDLTPHTTRPKLEILFLLNNNVASSCLIDDTNKYNDYYKEILDSYNIYKSIEEADSERMELVHIIGGEEKVGQKIKRI